MRFHHPPGPPVPPPPSSPGRITSPSLRTPRQGSKGEEEKRGRERGSWGQSGALRPCSLPAAALRPGALVPAWPLAPPRERSAARDRGGAVRGADWRGLLQMTVQHPHPGSCRWGWGGPLTSHRGRVSVMVPGQRAVCVAVVRAQGLLGPGEMEGRTLLGALWAQKQRRAGGEGCVCRGRAAARRPLTPRVPCRGRRACARRARRRAAATGGWPAG